MFGGYRQRSADHNKVFGKGDASINGRECLEFFQIERQNMSARYKKFLPRTKETEWRCNNRDKDMLFHYSMTSPRQIIDNCRVKNPLTFAYILKSPVLSQIDIA